MFKGIAFALAACLIWGLIFIVPQFMEGFTSIEVAMGRYLFYGIVSFLLFLRMRLKGIGIYPLSIWKKSFLYSLIFAVGYYPCVVLGLRYSTPPICALIMGIGPITIALYGNWKEKDCSPKSLIFPSIFIFMGLLLINAPALKQTTAPSTYFIGLAACFCALITWSWYVVANARFLKDNKEVKSSDWATLNGVSTLLCVLVGLVVAACFSTEALQLNKYETLTPQLTKFLIGSSILGVICSWVGIFLWNRATLYLPVSLAGQLTIFETIFGLLFIYLLEQRLPPVLEWIGIALFLAAIAYGIRKFSIEQAKEF